MVILKAGTQRKKVRGETLLEEEISRWHESHRSLSLMDLGGGGGGSDLTDACLSSHVKLLENLSLWHLSSGRPY